MNLLQRFGCKTLNTMAGGQSSQVLEDSVNPKPYSLDAKSVEISGLGDSDELEPLQKLLCLKTLTLSQQESMHKHIWRETLTL